MILEIIRYIKNTQISKVESELPLTTYILTLGSPAKMFFSAMRCKSSIAFCPDSRLDWFDIMRCTNVNDLQRGSRLQVNAKAELSCESA